MPQESAPTPRSAQRGSGSLRTPAALSAVGAVGSLVAWAIWTTPISPQILTNRISSAFQQIYNGSAALTPSTTSGMSHGFASGHGVVGLVAASVLLVATVVFVIPGRFGVSASWLAVIAGFVLVVNAIAGFVVGIQAYSSWSGASGGSGFDTFFFTHSIVPSLGACVAGALGLMGGIVAVRRVRTPLRGREFSPMPAPVRPVSFTAGPTNVDGRATAPNRVWPGPKYCGQCGSLLAEPVQFCGECGARVAGHLHAFNDPQIAVGQKEAPPGEQSDPPSDATTRVGTEPTLPGNNSVPRNRSILAVLVVIVVVLILGAGAVIGGRLFLVPKAGSQNALFGSSAATSTTSPITNVTTASTPNISQSTVTSVPSGAVGTIPSQEQAPAGTAGTAPNIAVPQSSPPTQLETADLITGTGPVAATGTSVTVQYVLATYSSGKEVQSSWTSQPFAFTLGRGQVIPGWDEGVVGMQVGGRRELIVPPSLGYGSQSPGAGIAPNDTLVFIIDMIKIN